MSRESGIEARVARKLGALRRRLGEHPDSGEREALLSLLDGFARHLQSEAGLAPRTRVFDDTSFLVTGAQHGG